MLILTAALQDYIYQLSAYCKIYGQKVFSPFQNWKNQEQQSNSGKVK